jgi:hypothetical protein
VLKGLHICSHHCRPSANPSNPSTSIFSVKHNIGASLVQIRLSIFLHARPKQPAVLCDTSDPNSVRPYQRFVSQPTRLHASHTASPSKSSAEQSTYRTAKKFLPHSDWTKSKSPSASFYPRSLRPLETSGSKTRAHVRFSIPIIFSPNCATNSQGDESRGHSVSYFGTIQQCESVQTRTLTLLLPIYCCLPPFSSQRPFYIRLDVDNSLASLMITREATPCNMGRGAYDTTGVPKPKPPPTKPR